MTDEEAAHAARVAAMVGVALTPDASRRVADFNRMLRGALSARPLPFESEPAQLDLVMAREADARGAGR